MTAKPFPLRIPTTLFTLLGCLLLFFSQPPVKAQEGAGGIGSNGLFLTPASVVNGVQIVFAVENNKTSIGVRVCGNAANFQVGVKAIEQPDSAVQLFTRTAAAGGCSPSSSNWWRLVFNSDPGPQIWRLYGFATDTPLPLDTFVQRAAYADCHITGLGSGSCTPSTTPPPTPALTGSLEAPGAGTSLAGVVTVSGWAADAGAWSGPGIDSVEVWVKGTLQGSVTYGQPRPDVATALGDPRFTNSGFSYQLNTSGLPPGPAALQVRFRSAISGAISVMERQVTIAAPTDTTLPDGQLTAPAIGAQIGLATQITATATDNQGGSGVARVDFFAAYDGVWHGIGSDTTAPYQTTLTLPQGTPSQQVLLTIHVYDNAGNQRLDPGGFRAVTFLASAAGTGVKENWVPEGRRTYLNQRALGADGWQMCSMSSVAMVRAMAGLVGRDTNSLVAEAQRMWNTGLRGPGITKVREYLLKNGMSANIIWTQNKDAHWSQLKAEIDAGRPVILNSNSNGGNLTSSGHYIVVVGYAEGGGLPRRIIVYDPYGEWRGTKGLYNVNSTSHSPPNGVKGRWKSYEFDKLGTVYSLTARPAIAPLIAQQAGQPLSLPDEIAPGADETIEIYNGDGEAGTDTQIFLPLLRS